MGGTSSLWSHVRPVLSRGIWTKAADRYYRHEKSNPSRMDIDSSSWTEIMAVYAEHGCAEDVLNCFEWMPCAGFSSSRFVYICALKACGIIKAEEKGYEIHGEIIKQALLENDVVLGTALLDMYAKCATLVEADHVFRALPAKNVVSWTALIGGYVQHGHGDKALECFHQMQREGTVPNAITFVCILKACGSIRAIEQGEDIHKVVVERGLVRKHRAVGNAIIDMYAKCGQAAKSQEAFHELEEQDVVSWTALISAYAQVGQGKEALNCFGQMQQNAILPNGVTFSCIVNACGNLQAADKGREIHAALVKDRHLGKNTIINNALVGMYARCGLLEEAQDMFEEIDGPDTICWTSLITGCVQHGQFHEGLHWFARMQIKGGPSPSAVTLASVLKACGAIGAMEKGEQVHGVIVREGLLEGDVVLGNALIYMYAKSGRLGKAEELVSDFPIRDVISWNTLLLGYAQHDESVASSERAFLRFEQMQCEGFCPTTVTMSCILKICGNLGASAKGQQVHAKILGNGAIAEETVIGNALVDMYTRCGDVAKARDTFDRLPDWDVASWNTMIAAAAYAHGGNEDLVFHLFSRMVRDGKEPDIISFTHLLNSCVHAGEVERIGVYLDAMVKSYGIMPTAEQYTCLVDLYGRAGDMGRAWAVIREMPLAANSSMWHALLSCCQRWGNIELGRHAFENATEVDHGDTAAYVGMSNVHAAGVGRPACGGDGYRSDEDLRRQGGDPTEREQDRAEPPRIGDRDKEATPVQLKPSRAKSTLYCLLPSN